MGCVLKIKRCVGESPPAYGARKAYSELSPAHIGPCYLKYELFEKPHIVQFANYQHALTAATMAIFCIDHDFKFVRISGNSKKSSFICHKNAKSWYSKISENYCYESGELNMGINCTS